MKPSRYSGPRPSDKWIPWYFVAFFIVLAAVDGVFVKLALSTHRGVVTEEAYQKGIAYNETIAEADAQAALGWQMTMRMNDTTLYATLHDADGKAMNDASLKVKATFVPEEGYDFEQRLEPAGHGEYKAALKMTAAGPWDLRVQASEGGKHFQKHQRFTILP